MSKYFIICKILVQLFSMIIFLSACMVGPNYVKPNPIVTTSMPTSYKESKGKSIMPGKGWKNLSPQDSFDRGKWWEVFHDHTLNDLECQLNHNNQTIVNAYQNYRQAKSLVDEARASFFPTLTGNYTLTRQKQGGSSSSFISTSATGTTSTGTSSASGGTSSKIETTQSLGFPASWVLDTWGQVARTVEAAAAGAQASAALWQSTRLINQNSLAQYYYQLRQLDKDQQILNETVVSYQQSLQLTKHQYVSGVAAYSDVIQAKTQLESAQAAAINNGILRGQYEHAIAVLIGLPPEKFSIKPNVKLVSTPAIPLNVPSALLERRPDIAEAERQVAQANAQIGADYAAFFPTITLSGDVSTAVHTGSLGQLLRFNPVSWAYGPQLSQLIFDGGLRSATVSADCHAFLASVANYRQVVLNAFQNVEDDLVSLRLLKQESAVQDRAAHDAIVSLQLVLNQYKSGIVQYSNVITAQVTAFNAEQTAADIKYQEMVSAANLIAALGGGWDRNSINCSAKCPMPPV